MDSEDSDVWVYISDNRISGGSWNVGDLLVHYGLSESTPDILLIRQDKWYHTGRGCCPYRIPSPLWTTYFLSYKRFTCLDGHTQETYLDLRKNLRQGFNGKIVERSQGLLWNCEMTFSSSHCYHVYGPSL